MASVKIFTSGNNFFRLTIAFGFALFLSKWVQDGMFVDGTLYAAVSNNLAQGLGSYFKPYYSETLYPEFYEHPPLVFILQSFFFKVFGNGFLTERIFCAFTLFFTCWGIILNWKIIGFKKESSWTPLFIFFCIPLVFWSYTNNMLENVLTVFTLFSSFYFIKTMKRNNWWLILPASLFLFLAFLSKGFVALFPISIPIIYACVWKEWNKGFKYTIYSILILIAIWKITILLFPLLEENIQNYIQQQLLPSLASKREVTVKNRFKIILDLILELSIPIILTIIALFIIKRNCHSMNYKKIGFFILIGLSASIPLIITLKQRKYYLLPSLPFFAIGIAYFLIQKTETTIAYILTKYPNILKILTISLFVLTVTTAALRFNTIGRDKEKLIACYNICERLNKNQTIQIPKHLKTEWGLRAYLQRIKGINLDDKNEHSYILSDEPLDYDQLKLIPIESNKYRLYKRLD